MLRLVFPDRAFHIGFMNKSAASKTTSTKRAVSPGRPREFDEAAALDKAMHVFWRQGFEATSLDDLTDAMGLSRSSFYGAFGSKQDVLCRAIEFYSKSRLARLEEIAAETDGNPLDSLMLAISGVDGGVNGCFMINCITELAPDDQKVIEIGRRHLEKIETLFAENLNPEMPEDVRDKARAYVSLAMGILPMRKAGYPPEQIENALKQAHTVLSP
ncbi:MAG: TetR/AcrR family transcriptional regulator [Roseibium sp.]